MPIRILPPDLADKIAAGEVAERPAAVVKELVENSIDAGARNITIEIKNGGITYIRVADDGCGIPADEVELAFCRHATGKISTVEDLYQIQTMGFRGEALCSICAVSDVTVITKTAGSSAGCFAKIRQGAVMQKDEIGCTDGTTMVVENLFASVPARMKFMKRDSTEAGYIADVLTRIALANPRISFKHICDDKEIFSTTGDGSTANAILKLYGREHASSLMDVDLVRGAVRVFGVVGEPKIAGGKRNRQTLVVNGRYIKNHVVSKVVEEAYENTLMRGKFPFYVLNITLPFELVDVNVHPAKTEIKFAGEKEVYESVYHAVKNALHGRTQTGAPPPATPPPQYAPLPQPQHAPPPRKQLTFSDSAAPKSHNSAPATADISEILDIYTTVYRTAERASADIPQKNLFDNAEIAGQIFDTYIVAQTGESVLIVDQHAAHERIRFEKLKQEFTLKRGLGQILLSGVVVDLTANEMVLCADSADELRKYGFEVDEFGNNAVIIRSTPVALPDDKVKDMFLEVLAALESSSNSRLETEERVLDAISCKYAVKANEKMTLTEMESLLCQLKELEAQNITTCPHGRPLRVEITKYELEKMFGRIQ